MMFFRRKQEAAAPSPPEKSPDEVLMERLAEWRPIGSEFEYLGRKMRVTSHGYFSLTGSCGIYMVRIPICQLKANYVDDNGVIRTHKFNREEVQRLMEGQP